tara:strand:+ start:1517 stop:1987 length:471 start_codon:yes stop_codon:yes gene_type:complete
MIKIDVFIEENSWKKYISNPKKFLQKKTKIIKDLIPFLKNKNIVFSILLTGNKKIKSFNKKYRNKNKTTDVLSFPFYEKKELKNKIFKDKETYLGDLILNYYKIKKNSKKDFIADFNKLWVHGFLHLLGHKHYKNKDFKKMNKLENIMLRKIQNNQ